MTYPCPECGKDAGDHEKPLRFGPVVVTCANTREFVLRHHADRLTASLAAMTAERDAYERRVKEKDWVIAEQANCVAASQARVKELEGVAQEVLTSSFGRNAKEDKWFMGTGSGKSYFALKLHELEQALKGVR